MSEAEEFHEEITSIEYRTPHKAKLLKTVANKKIHPSDIHNLNLALERYEDWISSMQDLKSEGDRRVEQLVELTNKYKRFLELQVIWDSKDSFLYRQRGQLKLDNSVIEEFLPYLVDDRIIPEIKGAEFLSGPYKAFASAYFTATLLNPLPGGGLNTRTKDQDFTVGRLAHIKSSFDPDFSPKQTVTNRVFLAFAAAECKTNLDKTMFQEAVSTARDIRTAIRGARYYLLCEWLDMTPISTDPTDIEEVIILRGRRIGSQDRDGLADPVTRSGRRDWYEGFLADNPMRYVSIQRFVDHLRDLFRPDDLDAENVVKRGYF